MSMSAGGSVFLHGARQPTITTLAKNIATNEDLIMSPLHWLNDLFAWRLAQNVTAQDTYLGLMVGVLQRESLENPVKLAQ